MADRTITIKVEEDFYRDIKIRIAKEGITLKEYILNLIREDLNRGEELL